ncbi:axoneme assembly protein [Aureococcus anophagefferens]|uniref:Axoneme assembly protein n=1 Tax=Aureococcus anophagefferens TaxID=44056 RepID=A0ABR1G7S4_AURAN
MRSKLHEDARPEDRCVHFLALEAEDLGFEVEWLSRTTGAAADDAPYASRTCRLTHAGWDGPVVLDFLAICGLVQISAVHGDRRSRSDVGAPRARRAAVAAAWRRCVLAAPVRGAAARDARGPAAAPGGPGARVPRRAPGPPRRRDRWAPVGVARRAARSGRACCGARPRGPGRGRAARRRVARQRARRRHLRGARARGARASDVVGAGRREVCRVVGEEEETVARRRDLARALFDFDDADRPYRISPFSPPAPPLEPTFARRRSPGPTWAPPWAFR